jgi:hypothetical protein
MSFYAATITVTCVATNQFVTIPHTGKLTENDFAAAVSLIDIPVEQAVDHFVNM